MKRYWKTGIQSLKTFIIGIKRDFQAVRNTIRLNVTNGMTEGFVNKLKVVKRSMYGRAGLELLKNKLVLEHILFNYIAEEPFLFHDFQMSIGLHHCR